MYTKIGVKYYEAREHENCLFVVVLLALKA